MAFGGPLISSVFTIAVIWGALPIVLMSDCAWRRWSRAVDGNPEPRAATVTNQAAMRNARIGSTFMARRAGK